MRFCLLHFHKKGLHPLTLCALTPSALNDDAQCTPRCILQHTDPLHFKTEYKMVINLEFKLKFKMDSNRDSKVDLDQDSNRDFPPLDPIQWTLPPLQ